MKSTIGRVASVANKTAAQDETVDMKDYLTFDSTIIKSVVVNRAAQTSRDTVYFGASDFRIYKDAQMVITLADGYTGYGCEYTFTSSNSGTVVTEVSADGKTITITCTKNVQFTSIDVCYKAN